MQRLIPLLICFVMSCALGSYALQAQLIPTNVEEATVPGTLLVKFTDPAKARKLSFKNLEQKSALPLAKSNDPLAKVLGLPGVSCFEPALMGNIKLASQVYCLRFDPEQITMEELEAKLESLSIVAYTERNMILQGFDDNDPPLPNDPLAEQQYILEVTSALEAYGLLEDKGNTATVAVIDDAVYLEHEDLRDNIWNNPGEMGTDANGDAKQSNGIDDDGNGFIDDFQGYDVADDDNDPSPPDSIPLRAGSTTEPALFHGTHVAGVAAAVTNNGKGVASLTNNLVEIIAVKSAADTNNTLSFTTIDLVNAMIYAVSVRADVVNLSLGSFFIRGSFLYSDIIDFGTANGTLFVSSAGNNPGPQLSFPAALDNVLSVAATNVADAAAPFTSYGQVDVAAPGLQILSTYVPLPGEEDKNPYARLSGTSFSCPFVAGLAALLRSQEPSLSPAELREIITSTADNIDALNLRLAGQLGSGRVNVFNALAEVSDVRARPVAEFFTPFEEVYTKQATPFINQSLGDDLRYRWIFLGGKPISTRDEDPTVTYPFPGRYPVFMVAQNRNGFDAEIKREYVTVQPIPRVDVVGLPFEGPIGTDTTLPLRGETQPTKLLVYPEDRLLTSVRASFFSLPEPGGFFGGGSLGVWRVNNGQTATLLLLQPLDIDSLVATGDPNEPFLNDILLDEPLEITANDTFLVGFESAFDPILPHYTDGNGFDSYINFRSVAEARAGDDFSWMIYPTLVTPAFIPEPPSLEGVCAGEEAVLDASQLNPAFDYSWQLESTTGFVDTTLSLAGPVARVTLDSGLAADYRVGLRAERDVVVNRLDTAFEVRLRVVQSTTLPVADCDLPPVATFTSTESNIEEGQQITYTVDPGTNGTDFDWSFPGGQPNEASGRQVTITYPEAGIYDVILAVSQNDGDSDVLVAGDYAIVGDESCADFDVLGLPLSSLDVVSGLNDLISGQGPDSLLAFGNLFTSSPEEEIYGVRAVLGSLRADDPETDGVTIYAWDNDGPNGTPGTVLAERRYTYSELRDLLPPFPFDEYFAETPQDQTSIDIRFDDPVAVPADSSYILGYEVEYGDTPGAESFIVLYNFSGESSGETSFVQFPSGFWSNYSDASNDLFNIRLGLGAIVGDPEAIDAPVADIDGVDQPPYTAGQVIRFTTGGSNDAAAVRWEVEFIETLRFPGFEFSFASTLTLNDGNDLFTAIDDETVALQTFEPFPGDKLAYRIVLTVVNECGVEDIATRTIEFESAVEEPAAIASAPSDRMVSTQTIGGSATQAFPNPTSGMLTISGLEAAAPGEELTLYVIDALGRTLVERKQAIVSAVEVDMNSMPDGWYHVLLRSQGRSITHRVLKQ